jgi:hypothetical protein
MLRRFVLSIATILAVGNAGALAVAHQAAAHDQLAATAATPTAAGAATFFVANLEGRNEVPVAGGPAVGDPDGHALEVLRLSGDQLTFAITWRGIGAPVAGHIHVGAAGVNGAVVVPFFGTPLPATLTAIAGTVTVDPALARSIRANPGGFYANLHTAEFPGGAVRGQLHAVGHPVDLNQILRGDPLATG